MFTFELVEKNNTIHAYTYLLKTHIFKLSVERGWVGAEQNSHFVRAWFNMLVIN